MFCETVDGEATFELEIYECVSFSERVDVFIGRDTIKINNALLTAIAGLILAMFLLPVNACSAVDSVNFRDINSIGTSTSGTVSGHGLGTAFFTSDRVNFNAAHAAAAAVPSGFIVLDSTSDLTSSLTTSVPIIWQGGLINKVSGTLTINGTFSAGTSQVFSGFLLGDVAFGRKSVKEICPQWFGAKGDGVTDDTRAINTAVSAVTEGGIVALPSGTYMIKTAGAKLHDSSNGTGIIISKSLKLVLDKNAILQAIPNSSDYTEVIQVKNTSDVEISGGTILGDRFTHTGSVLEFGYLIHILNSSNVYVHDMKLTLPHGDCAIITSSLAYQSNFRFERVIFDRPRRWGLSIGGGKGLTVRDCKFTDTSSDLSFGGAVDIEEEYYRFYRGTDTIRDVLFDHNEFENNELNGSITIQAYSSMNNIKIVNNKFRSVTYGVNAQGPIRDLLIEGNSFSEFNYGIILFGGNSSGQRGQVYVRVKANAFTDSPKANAMQFGGISTGVVSGVLVEGNSFDNLKMGIYDSIGTLSNNAIIGNTFSNCRPINIGHTSRGYQIIGNTVTSGLSSQAGIDVTGINTLVSGNVIATAAAGSDGISNSATNALITNNQVYGFQRWGIHTTVDASNCIVSNNFIYSSGAQVGVYGQNPSRGIKSFFTDNKISGTYSNGEINMGSAHYYVSLEAYQLNTGNPNGRVTPRYIGDMYLDTSAKVWYKAASLVNIDWKALN